MTDSSVDNASAARCLVNGHLGAAVPVTDRGLAYGDGVFETMRVGRGRIALLDYHLNRLRRGLAALRMPVDLAATVLELEAEAERLHTGVIKLTLTRGTGRRGYAIPAEFTPTRICQSFPLVSHAPEHAREGVRLFECQTRLALQPMLAGIKHLNRLEQVLARSEWSDPGYAEGLVRDTQGNVIECTMSNLFLLENGYWVTPDLGSCGVQGVMRDYLIDQLARIDEPVSIRSVPMATVLSSDEVFCCNSLYGVWPVVGLAQSRWPVGPRTRRVQALAEQVLV